MTSSRIILSTINARYLHTAFGLRYLMANMGPLQNLTRIQEFTLGARPVDMAEEILKYDPDIVGLGIYIWNYQQSLELLKILKTLKPDLYIVLGGPEVSFENADLLEDRHVDYIISGQADLAFAQLCQSLLDGKAPDEKLIPAPPPLLKDLCLPYQYYSDTDIKNRIIYVEASRGCPFKCEFCLSALDKTAINFDLQEFLAQMDILYHRGVRHFKFVDRTFNLNKRITSEILNFFLVKQDESLFLHFELIPDHLPDELKALIAEFGPNNLQFEIGIQSFDSEVQKLISRKQNNQSSQDNLHWLRNHSNAHIHADLILGLPGDTLSSIKQSFNTLYALRPHEIQVGILKRLKGTPIIRHTDHFSMKYNPTPPYTVLSTNLLDFPTMQLLGRFARYWDMYHNSGRFRITMEIFLHEDAFDIFWRFSTWIYQQNKQTHKISLHKQFDFLIDFLIESNMFGSEYHLALEQDFLRSGQKGRLQLGEETLSRREQSSKPKSQSRQLRHQR